MKIFVGLLTAFAAVSARAELVQCPDVRIVEVVVEGARDDGFVLQNKLVIRTVPSCAGKEFIHLSIGDPAFSGILSIALTAKATGSKSIVAVNTSEQTAFSNKAAFVSVAE